MALGAISFRDPGAGTLHGMGPYYPITASVPVQMAPAPQSAFSPTDPGQLPHCHPLKGLCSPFHRPCPGLSHSMRRIAVPRCTGLGGMAQTASSTGGQQPNCIQWVRWQGGDVHWVRYEPHGKR